MLLTSEMKSSVSFFFFSSRRRHTRCSRDWSSDVCSSDLNCGQQLKWERVLNPILRDDGLDLGFHERAHLLQDRPLIGGEKLYELGEVRNWLGEGFFFFFFLSCPEGFCFLFSFVFVDVTPTKNRR